MADYILFRSNESDQLRSLISVLALQTVVERQVP